MPTTKKMKNQENGVFLSVQGLRKWRNRPLSLENMKKDKARKGLKISSISLLTTRAEKHPKFGNVTVLCLSFHRNSFFIQFCCLYHKRLEGVLVCVCVLVSITCKYTCMVSFVEQSGCFSAVGLVISETTSANWFNENLDHFYGHTHPNGLVFKPQKNEKGHTGVAREGEGVTTKKKTGVRGSKSDRAEGKGAMLSPEKHWWSSGKVCTADLTDYSSMGLHAKFRRVGSWNRWHPSNDEGCVCVLVSTCVCVCVCWCRWHASIPAWYRL